MRVPVVILSLFAILFGHGLASNASAQTVVSLTTNPTNPQVSGASVVFSATASGGTGQYEYKFLQHISGNWVVVQPYSTTATWTWNTAGEVTGPHYFTVYARSVGSLLPYEVTKFASYSIIPKAATATTLTTNLTSPQVAGTSVIFSSTASGGTGQYEYQFLQKISGNWVVVQPYSTSSTWTWGTAGTEPGTYYFTVYARSVGSLLLYEATKFASYSIIPKAATATTLTTNLTSPQVAGVPVVFSASASGGTGQYEYQFLQKISGNWVAVQPYSTSSTWTWGTAGTEPGTYYFTVYARSVGSLLLYEATKFASYTIGATATTMTFTTNLASPQIANVSVMFSASVSNALGNYEYQFWRQISGKWVVVQPYSISATWTWDTISEVPGPHYFTVYARSVGSLLPYEVTNFASYTIVPKAATGTTLTSNLTSPQIAGISVIFSSTASGGSGQYEYQFLQHTNGKWVVVQPYSTSSNWTWDTAGTDPGTYYFTVYARSVGSLLPYEVSNFASYTIVPKAATDTTLTTNVASPQIAGISVVFSASASGGSGQYEYQFLQHTNGNWVVVQPYSTSSSWTWDTAGTDSGTYYFTVYARSVGSLSSYEASTCCVNFRIRNPITILSNVSEIAIQSDNLYGAMLPIVTDLIEWPSTRQYNYDTILNFLGTGPSSMVPLDPQIISEEILSDHIRRRVQYQVESDEWVPAYLLIPIGYPFPRPAVIALHQSNPIGKRETVGLEGDTELAYGLDLVRRGYVVLASDSMMVGERLKDGEIPFDMTTFWAKRPEWSAVGKMLWDNQRGIDYLQTLPEVDPENIGVIGHSIGGTNALFLGAFDSRIKAVISSCGYTRIETDPEKERWMYYIPQLIPYVNEPIANDVLLWDMQHLVSLIWPRPIFQNFALQDSIFPPVMYSEPLPNPFISTSITVAQTRETLLPLFQEINRGDSLQTYYFDGPHSFPIELHDLAYNFMDQFLVTPNNIIDTTAPTGTIRINNGATSTNSQSVILTLSASDTNGISYMKFSLDDNDWSVSEPYWTSRKWTYEPSDGVKTIFVKYQDSMGNWSDSYGSSIILDTSIP